MSHFYLRLLAIAVTCYVAVAAQDKMSPTQADSRAEAPLMTLKGTFKANGDKYTFVNDKDGKSWEVTNPELVKGHEGRHVEIRAHVYADKREIHIMSVKMIPGGPPTGDDPPKRPTPPPPPPN